MTMNKKKIIALNLFIFSISVFITLFFLEAGVRIYYYGIMNTLTGKVSTVVPISMTGLLRLSDNDKIVYELKPNAEGLSKFVTVKTNPDGFRDKTYSLEKANDVYRIAIIGDSITFGIGVAQEEIFSERLETSLHNLCGKNKVEVINFGVPAYNTTQELEVLKIRALPYKPDLVIIAYYLNDIFPPVDISRDLEFSLKGFFYKHSHLFRLVYDRIKESGWQSDRKMSYTQELAVNYSDDSKLWQERKSEFKEFRKISEENNFKVIFMLIPSMIDFGDGYPFRGIDNRVLNEARKNEFLILDLLPFFKGQDPEKLCVLKADRHPNPTGHKIIADAIYGFLVKERAICRN